MENLKPANCSFSLLGGKIKRVLLVVIHIRKETFGSILIYLLVLVHHPPHRKSYEIYQTILSSRYRESEQANRTQKWNIIFIYYYCKEKKKKERKWKGERSNKKCSHDIRCNIKMKIPLSRITKPYTATGYITIPQPYFLHECTYECSP